MENITQLYVELKEQISEIRSYFLMFTNTDEFDLAERDVESDAGKMKAEFQQLNDFNQFLRSTMEQFDNEPESDGLKSMKAKSVKVVRDLLDEMKNNAQCKEVIDFDNTIEYYQELNWNYSRGKAITPLNLLRRYLTYLHSILFLFVWEAQAEGWEQAMGQQAGENELPPVEVEPLKSAANYVVLLHELGILEHLKNRYPNIRAQRLGELCERITGQETEYFRQAISQSDPSTNKAFNPRSKQKIKAFLLQFGIEVNEKSKGN